MNTFRLDGLSGSHPLGAMAAFGLLRILSRESPFGTAKLAWQFRGDWYAELHLQADVTLDGLIDCLIERQPTRAAAPWFAWNDDIKSSIPKFRNEWLGVFQAHERSVSEDNEAAATHTDEYADFLACFGSETVLAKSKPEVKPTGFHMTAGQQRFLKVVKEIANSLDPTGRATKRQSESDRRQELQAAFCTALVGPWTYKDSSHSLGWDPSTEGLHALSDRSPSDAGPTSVRAAVWLAFESLPLFPAVPESRVLHTTGFNKSGSQLSWPIWQSPISIETLRCLVSLPELHERQIDTKQLAQRGVSVVMRCRCVRDGKGRGTLRNTVGINGTDHS